MIQRNLAMILVFVAPYIHAADVVAPPPAPITVRTQEGLADPEKQEAAMRQFVAAFFSEDQTTLESLSARELLNEIATHFWFNATLQKKFGNARPARPAWTGKIEIVKTRQEEILWEHAMISVTHDAVYTIKVDGVDFEVAVNAENKVTGFHDGKAQAKAGPAEKPK